MRRCCEKEDMLYVGQSFLHSFIWMCVHSFNQESGFAGVFTGCYDYEILQVCGAEQAGRVCDESLSLAVFMPVPHCLQQKGKDGADGSAGSSAPAWGGHQP